METGLLEEISADDAALVRFGEFHFTATLGLLGLTVALLRLAVGLTMALLRLAVGLLGLTVGLALRLTVGLTVGLTGLTLTTTHLIRVSETSNFL